MDSPLSEVCLNSDEEQGLMNLEYIRLPRLSTAGPSVQSPESASPVLVARVRCAMATLRTTEGSGGPQAAEIRAKEVRL